MRILVPLCLEPGEFLASRPELFLELGLRAVQTAVTAASALPGGAAVLIAHQRLTQTALERLPRSGATFLGLPPDAPTRGSLPFLPTGAEAALERLPSPSRDAPVAVLDPRHPLLEIKDLLGAAARFAQSDAPLMLSAAPPRDHPCQGRCLYALDSQPQPLGQGARLAAPEDGPSAVVLDRPLADIPAMALLVLLGRGERLILTEARDHDGRTAFDLPAGTPPPEDARWVLAAPCPAPGPGRFLLPRVPRGAPWGLDARSGRVQNAAGRTIAGRQDFPPLLAPDGGLCLLAAPAPSLEKDAEFRHLTWELPPERTLCVRNALAEVAWRLKSGARPPGPAAPPPTREG